jgi:hypothetical protein
MMMASTLDQGKPPAPQIWDNALSSLKTDLGLSDDAIALFAVQLYFGIDDIQSVANEALTGGGDDKKCDLLYIDAERQAAVIAQAYFSRKERPEAPANKAADLNTAVSWLISRPLDDLPETLRGRASEFRDNLKSGVIKEIRIWYVHNLPASKNVADELKTVSHTGRSALEVSMKVKDIPIFAEEFGRARLSLYEQAERAIIVVDEIPLPVRHYLEITAGKWKSLITTVSGVWLHNLYKQHSTNLFSANVREYLGSRASDSNINNGIKRSAVESPEDFFVYNNGLTAIVNDYEIDRVKRGISTVRMKGISIVNGAQTTGSLGSLDAAPDPSVQLPMRIVKTSDPSRIENIVRYNNSQNKVQAADFRSTDTIQNRLRQEFERAPDVAYDGGRRGGASDAMRRRKNLLPSYTAGQALAAFHGDPVLAYDKKADIWTLDALYLRYFNDKTTARHIIFCVSLVSCLTKKRLRLMELTRNGDALTDQQKLQLSFLDKKGAAYLIVHAISQGLETILERVVTNRFGVRFRQNLSIDSASTAWEPIVDIYLALSAQLDSAFNRNRIANERLKDTTQHFNGVIQSLSMAYGPQFKAFSDMVELD